MDNVKNLYRRLDKMLEENKIDTEAFKEIKNTIEEEVEKTKLEIDKLKKLYRSTMRGEMW